MFAVPQAGLHPVLSATKVEIRTANYDSGIWVYMIKTEGEESEHVSGCLHSRILLLSNYLGVRVFVLNFYIMMIARCVERTLR